jgi:hypothetical protein
VVTDDRGNVVLPRNTVTSGKPKLVLQHERKIVCVISIIIPQITPEFLYIIPSFNVAIYEGEGNILGWSYRANLSSA